MTRRRDLPVRPLEKTLAKPLRADIAAAREHGDQQGAGGHAAPERHAPQTLHGESLRLGDLWGRFLDDLRSHTLREIQHAALRQASQANQC